MHIFSIKLESNYPTVLINIYKELIFIPTRTYVCYRQLFLKAHNLIIIYLFLLSRIKIKGIFRFVQLLQFTFLLLLKAASYFAIIYCMTSNIL